jgi:hypothetical protein
MQPIERLLTRIHTSSPRKLRQHSSYISIVKGLENLSLNKDQLQLLKKRTEKKKKKNPNLIC